METIRYEENDEKVKFSSGWSNVSLNDLSGKNAKYSNTKGNYVEFSFTGCGIKWIGTGGPTKGKALVYIDDNEPVTIDTYRKVNTHQLVLFENNSLSYGQHTIKIVVDGTKNPDSTRSYIVVDAFDVTQYKIQNVRYEETDKSVSFSSGWSNVSLNDLSGKNAKYSNTKGNYVEFSFTGCGIKWIGTGGPTKGKALVYIDDNEPVTIDTYRKVNTHQLVLFENNSLPYGQHTIKIVVDGTKNPDSTRSYIVVDAFDVIK